MFNLRIKKENDDLDDITYSEKARVILDMA